MKIIQTCPHCKKQAHFIPEELPCDGSLLLWCDKCGNEISITTTIKTYQNWWENYYKGEATEEPPFSEEVLHKLDNIQTTLTKLMGNGTGETVNIHFQDFREFQEVIQDESK